MTLTRAQIVGLYGLAMNMPVDTTIEVESVDSYGHAIIRAASEQTAEARRFKLYTQGGTAVLD